MQLPTTLNSLATAAALAFIAVGPAQAAINGYGDRTSFLAATGSTDATGALPAPGGSVSNSTVGSVTFQAPSFLFVDWSTLLVGSELVVSNGAGSVGGVYNDGIDVLFAAPVFAAGFDFHEPTSTGLINGCNVNPCSNSQYELQLYSGAALVGTHSWTPPKDQATFVGVASTLSFDRMLVRETVGTDDNEFYGRFYTSTTPVPEPAQWLLLGSGLLALRSAKGRRA